MAIKNYREVCDALYPHLSEYLTEHGYNTERLFHCLNPNHNDSSASCGVAPSGKVFNCFGCSYAGNIFHAAHILEGKPMAGKEFVYETLLPLAEKYNVNVEMEPLTEEEIYEMDTYRAYRTAADLIISGTRTESFTNVIAEKGWSDDTCREYGVGCVSNYKELREMLKRSGFQAAFLDDIDLSRKEVFGEDRLIFTIRDEFGRPVGFSSRNLSYTDDEQHGSKYCNQKSTGVKCNIYRKSSRLYGFDRVLAHNTQGNQPIYIFEGYGDVITAAQHGLYNCVALAGLHLTIDQIFLLRTHHFHDIIICLDGDKAGQQQILGLLDNVLTGQKDLRVKIVSIPDGMDPDDFIRANGMEAFLELRVWDAFEWRLAQYETDTDPELICKNLLPLIASESSFIAQERMCKVLAAETGVSLKAIGAELERLQNHHVAELARDRRLVLDQLTQNLERNPDGAEVSMSEALSSLFNINKQQNEDIFSEIASLNAVIEQRGLQEAKDGSFSGYVLDEDLNGLSQVLSGNWKQDVWCAIGGKENSGKTSFAVKMANAIAEHEEENDAIVIYHSIDDTIPQILPKFVCVNDGTRRLTLNQVDDPNYHIARLPIPVRDSLLQQRTEAYNRLVSKMQKGLLVLKDQNDGIGLGYTEQLIRYYRNKYPSKNIVYFLDNFHLLPEASNERIEIKKLSSQVKSIATKYHITLISTVEYRKTQERATNEDISETGQIKYDANLIMHVHNELHQKQARCNPALVHYHQASDSIEPVMMPVIEINIGKNKISTFKGTLYYKFFTNSSDFEEVNARIMNDKLAATKQTTRSRRAEAMPFGVLDD